METNKSNENEITGNLRLVEFFMYLCVWWGRAREREKQFKSLLTVAFCYKFDSSIFLSYLLNGQ